MKSLHDLKIFIVDDDTFWLEMFSGLLTSQGYKNIQRYKSGQACLDHLKENPDLIFLDYQMDGADGLTILKGIKDYHASIIVIFTTGLEDLRVAVDAMKFGALDFLLKTNVTKSEIQAVFRNIKESITNTGKIF